MQGDVLIWLLVVAAVLLVAGVALVATTRVRATRRTAALRRHFGPEYDNVVEQQGSRRRGESVLQARLKRRRQLDIRPLDPSERERFDAAWQQAQGTFVDTPRTGLREADLLVMQVMRDRGYPVEHFEERAELVSVDHPALVGHFRAAHTVAVADQEDEVSTEELREAMVDYRYLFDELIGGGGGEPDRTGRA